MAINPLFPHLARLYGNASPVRPGQDGTESTAPKSGPDSTGLGGDQFSVSPAARSLPDAIAAARSASELRLNKVENLSNQIAGGTYQVDYEKLARNLAPLLKLP